MLELKKVTKIYETGGFKQKALDEVDICFRENEFTSVLGPSGSGKTTLLNIIGGLDQYTSGDLKINEISTKKFKDKVKGDPLLSGVIPNQKYIAFNNDSLLVPLQGSKGYGGIVSAVTPNLDRISSNYLVNVNDLKTAAILNNREPTFFILSPTDDELDKLDSDKAEKIDSLIESLNRKQEQQGIKIECETSELILLDKIKHWALKAA